MKYQPYDFRAFLVDDELSVANVVAEHVAPEYNALFHSSALTPLDALRGFAAFLLRYGAHHRQTELVVGLVGINTVVHEYQADTVLAELTRIVDSVEQISGEARHLFCDDHIKFAVLTVADHAVEVLALIGVGASDSLVNIDLSQLPQRVSCYVFVEVPLLTFERVRLIELVGRYAAVGCHAQYLAFSFHFVCLL